MQNRGFIMLFAILLAAVSAYYLSFSLVTKGVMGDADQYAQQTVAAQANLTGLDKDNVFYVAKQHYLDSITTQPVYNFLFIRKFTYAECRSQEINLGLDLKGGMNVTLEISVPDVLRSLSNFSTDKTFNRAIDSAQILQNTNRGDFVSLFGQAFNEIDPGAKLAPIFLYSLKENIKQNSSNDQVIAVLKDQIDIAIKNSYNVLRTRIDRFGVVQPNIQMLKTNGRILVELPGVKDPERVRKLLQGTANLEFWVTYNAADILPQIYQANQLSQAYFSEQTKKDTVKANTAATPETALDSLVAKSKETESQGVESLFKYLTPNGQVARYASCVIGAAVNPQDTAKINMLLNLPQIRNILPRDLKLMWTVKAENVAGPTQAKDEHFLLVACKVTTPNGRAPLAGDVVTNANSEMDPNNNPFFAVNMQMNTEGARIWAGLTRDNIHKSVAIVLDGFAYSYPTIQGEIKGNTQITGNFSADEAKDLANVLSSGRMPAKVTIIQENVVGPSLGQEAIHDGFMSFGIAFLVVLLYMIFYYGLTAGIIADIALLCNLFFMMGVLVSFNAVLTLPGIAGIVLTIGMSVDGNVLIYERIREELAEGKNLKTAIQEGFKNAFSAIFDSNLTTFITALILFIFGSGPIKGFATTLMIGILTSFFSAVFVSRLIFEWILKKDIKVSFTTRITKNWFKNANFNFIGMRNKAYVISGTIILLSIISLSWRGLDQGIDFTGGRNYTVRFDDKVNTEAVRAALIAEFKGTNPSVKDLGQDGRQVKISTNYLVASDSSYADDSVAIMLYHALKPFIPATVSQHDFVTPGSYLVSSDKVGPTIANDIKFDAVLAVFCSLIAIFLYILLRFRNWQYSLGAVLSLAHDTLIVLGMFSLLYPYMPFSMEMDQAFIAAILTVIGYSINDTVVIFDRLREYVHLHPKADRAQIMNNALNSTLGRTFSTSFSTFVVILTIFLFGGEVIQGFIFALLIGIIVGTYSSVFIATPIAYDAMKRKLEENRLKELSKAKR